MNKKLIIVAAMGENREIGMDNKLPWSIPADMAHFRKLTMGQTLLMGRKTAESIGFKLKGRDSLVMTHQDRAPYPGQHVVRSLEEAFERSPGDLYLVGGAQLYRDYIHLADELHITYVAKTIPEADAFFPEIDMKLFQQISAMPYLPEDPNIPDYAFWVFRRREEAALPPRVGTASMGLRDTTSSKLRPQQALGHMRRHG